LAWPPRLIRVPVPRRDRPRHLHADKLHGALRAVKPPTRTRVALEARCFRREGPPSSSSSSTSRPPRRSGWRSRRRCCGARISSSN